MLNGQKKWIGNATFADVTIIWARDEADNQVKGFMVENKHDPGFKAEKIEHKMALRVVQNALITMENCRVPEANRLQKRLLPRYCSGLADDTGGRRMGGGRLRDGRLRACARLRAAPQAIWQTHRQIPARSGFAGQMLGNITASQCMVLRLSQMQDRGK